MPSNFVDGVSQTNILNLAQQQKTQGAKYGAGATAQLAQSVGDLYAANPWLSPGQVLALAKGEASPQAVSLASDLQAKGLQTQLDPTNKPSKGWFERNVFEKVKATTRWSFAALESAPNLVQNVAAQAFSSNDPEGFDGWFKSTELGTMVADSKDAGSGWFMGQEAKERQGERARRVRGTINGSAFTIGRGAASLVSVPGSRQYNVLSGFLDAAVLVGADPTVYGGKVLAALRGARAIIPGLKTAGEIELAGKVAARGLAGLSEGEQVAWEATKYMKFATSDKRMTRLAERVVEESDPVAMLRDVFKYNMDLGTVRRFTNAKSVDEVFGILGEQTVKLDDAATKFLPDDIRRIPGAVKAPWIRERVPGYNTWRQSMLFTEMPDSLVIHGTSADRVKGIKDYSNYLNTLEGGFAQSDAGKAILDVVFRAAEDGGSEGLKLADEAFNATVRMLLKKEGVSEPVVAKLFETVAQMLDDTKRYWMDLMGNPEDAGFVQSMISGGYIDRKTFMKATRTTSDEFDALGAFKAQMTPEQIDSLKLHGPGAIAELVDRAHVLPDVRVVRRLTGNPFIRKALAKESGDPRAAVAFTELMQNQIWKPLTLATGGYIFRNMADAQVRIATVGKEGIFNHPVRYLQYVMHNKAPETILGQAFQDTLKYTDQAQVDSLISAGRAAKRSLEKDIKLSKADRKVLKKAADEGDKATKYMEGALNRQQSFDEGVSVWAENQMHGMSRNLSDPVQAQLGAYRRGSMQQVNKGSERPEWLKGLGGEYVRMATDSIESMTARGVPTEEIIRWLRQDPAGQKNLKALERYLRDFGLVDEAGITTRASIKQVDDTVLGEWVEKFGHARVSARTGGDEDLRFAIGYRRVALKTSEVVDPKDFGPLDIVRGGPITKGKGTTVILQRGDEELLGVVTDIIDTPNGPRWQVQHVSPYDIVDEPLGRGRKQLDELIASKADAVKADGSALLPENSMLPSLIAQDPAGLNRMMDWFFSGVYGWASQKFEKSPVFRQYYYDHIARNADALTNAEAQKLVGQIIDRAAANEMKPENFVGSKKVWDTILDAEKNANGTGIIKQLDEYAQLRALDETKQLLYDASSRNNLEDIMRVLIPFGVAYREVVGTYLKFMVEDPTRIRRAQLMFTGVTNADPDGDGDGFFYKDPTSGEYAFNFPFSGELTKLLTGTASPLQGQVKRLSMGLSVIPSLGPVGQIAAHQLLPDTPKFDAVVEILFPYGRDPKSPLPGWAVKLGSALRADPSKLDTIYANTYVDTLRALSTSGDYDLSTEEGKIALMDDAKGKAQKLTFLRALGQFIGPTSPAVEFEITTKNGDMYASQLVKEFYALQNDNYQTAVSEFLRIFGDDAMLYLSSKSKATVGGLEASDVFGDWTRNNPDLFNLYPKVAGYFAPTGEDFSFTTWAYQARTGKRVRLTDAQVIEQAQYRAGAAQYRSYRDQVGAYPTGDQREWLRGVRTALSERYPGFPAVAVFEVGGFDQRLDQMRRAVEHSSLEGNPVAAAVKTYLGYHGRVIAQYVAQGGSAQGFEQAKGAEALRDYLASIGEALVAQTPEFGRIWDRELSGQVTQ